MRNNFSQVTIVCVTYNSENIIPSLADSLRLFENVIVVDNASRDQSADLVRQLAPHAKLIVDRKNEGFGAANNRAVTQAQTPLVLLLNPDCLIEAAALAELVSAMNTYSQAGIVSPQAFGQDRAVQISYRQAFYEKRAHSNYLVPEAICSSKWLTGCCMLVRVEHFREIGGFDDRFFLYYEDDDLCLRMVAAGHECLIQPAATVMHIGGAASTPSWRTDVFKHFHYFRSRQMMIRTYVGAGAALQYHLKTLMGAVPALLIYGVAGQGSRWLKWLGWSLSALTPHSFLFYTQAPSVNRRFNGE